MPYFAFHLHYVLKQIRSTANGSCVVGTTVKNFQHFAIDLHFATPTMPSLKWVVWYFLFHRNFTRSHFQLSWKLLSFGKFFGWSCLLPKRHQWQRQWQRKRRLITQTIVAKDTQLHFHYLNRECNQICIVRANTWICWFCVLNA